MTLLHKSERAVVLSFSPEELVGVSNALNEVCHGVFIDGDEFATRLGISRDALAGILSALSSAHAAPSSPVA
jgi:hypothetical protein